MRPDPDDPVWMNEFLPKLKPCPKCGAELEYYASIMVGCKSNTCDFTKVFDESLETHKPGEET